MSIIHDALKKVQHSLDRNYGRTSKPSAHGQEFTAVQTPKAHKPVSPHDITTTRPDQWPVKAFLLLSGTILICLGIILVLVLKIMDSDNESPAQPSPLVQQRLQQLNQPSAGAPTPPRQTATVNTSAPAATVAAAPKQTTAPITTRQQPATTTAPDQDELILGGIMAMGEERVALINDDVYALGDTIENKRIVDITLKEVVLQEADGTITTLKVLNRR